MNNKKQGMSEKERKELYAQYNKELSRLDALSEEKGNELKDLRIQLKSTKETKRDYAVKQRQAMASMPSEDFSDLPDIALKSVATKEASSLIIDELTKRITIIESELDDIEHQSDRYTQGLIWLDYVAQLKKLNVTFTKFIAEFIATKELANKNHETRNNMRSFWPEAINPRLIHLEKNGFPAMERHAAAHAERV